MYPRGSENHQKSYCADGACQAKRKGEDDIPDWPQPQGIYVKGTQFHPIKFLKISYCGTCTNGSSYMERSTDLPVEYEAFGKVLERRTTIDDDGSVLFRLCDLVMPPSTPDSLLVLHNGHKHLRLDCLRDD